MRTLQLTLRTIGFLGSLLLTLGAYFVIIRPGNLDPKSAVILIFSLAALQALVQLICFINLWKEKGPLWNLILFLSTISIIFIVVAFSIWIMHHLNVNMMPS